MAKLAEAIARKAGREAAQHPRRLDLVADDPFTIIRQAWATHHPPFCLNADERRERDCYWNTRYGVATAPLHPLRCHFGRSHHDCLRQDLRRHPEAQPTGHRAQEIRAKTTKARYP